MSLKISNCTPDQLPHDLQLRLMDWLGKADAQLMQGFIRPGCTHLIVDVAQPLLGSPTPLPQQLLKGGAAEDLVGALVALLGRDLAASNSVTLQCLDQVGGLPGGGG